MCWEGTEASVLLGQGFPWNTLTSVKEVSAGVQAADSPLAGHQALVDVAIPQDLLVEQLIGQQHQQRGHGLEQDAVGDVPGHTTENNK